MARGTLESDVMEALWQAGEPLPVRAVLDTLNRTRTEQLAYTTVMTVLTRLAEKGALERTRHGRGFLYTPVAEDEAGLAVREVLRRYGDAAVAHFVSASAADPQAKERLRRLLDQQEGG
ncbi:BlaI/MecI/CopY family transcriptional regulator [Streptomyces coelicoflavus]|uniref:BlaI/MecI/CopY family transcriptional regulator n=1 Tax=Streptomyces coelicoflavus TaxID=285562 RepID=UPI0036B5A4AC